MSVFLTSVAMLMWFVTMGYNSENKWHTDKELAELLG